MSDLHIHTIRRVPRPEKRPTRLSAFILWTIAAAGLVLFPLISPLMDGILGGLNPHVQNLITNLLYYLLFAALPVFLLARRTPGLFMAYRPNPISLFNVICVVVVAMLGMFFANDLTVLWAIPLEKLGFDVFSSALPAATNTFELALSVLYVAVLPGICEEFLFRGAVLPAFEGEGTKRAMLASSLLFMLVHGTVAGAPVQFILGMILSYLVIWTDSIYAGLIYHTTHNAAAVILQFAQDRTAATAETPAQATILEMIGGMEGVGMLAMEVLFSGAMILLTLKMFRLRGRLSGIAAETGEKKPLRASEIAVIILGVILCAVLYAMDAATSLMGG